jgi:hypothetical protein
MSTTPPEQPTTQQPGYSRTPDFSNVTAMMPVPGNAELIVYVLATILVAIIALAADQVDSGAFVTAFTALTFAYLLSRGIAKASRVLER